MTFVQLLQVNTAIFETCNCIGLLRYVLEYAKIQRNLENRKIEIKILNVSSAALCYVTTGNLIRNFIQMYFPHESSVAFVLKKFTQK